MVDHADEEAQADRLCYDEIFDSVIHGRLIEDYPDDKPYPSCLVYGSTRRGEPVHSVWAYDSDTEWAVMITTYRPDPTMMDHRMSDTRADSRVRSGIGRLEPGVLHGVFQ